MAEGRAGPTQPVLQPCSHLGSRGARRPLHCGHPNGKMTPACPLSACPLPSPCLGLPVLWALSAVSDWGVVPEEFLLLMDFGVVGDFVGDGSVSPSSLGFSSVSDSSLMEMSEPGGRRRGFYIPQIYRCRTEYVWVIPGEEFTGIGWPCQPCHGPVSAVSHPQSFTLPGLSTP